MTVILPLRRLRQEDCEFKTSLCYIRPVSKQNQKRAEGRKGSQGMEIFERKDVKLKN
jgi:hypothetical protein